MGGRTDLGAPCSSDYGCSSSATVRVLSFLLHQRTPSPSPCGWERGLQAASVPRTDHLPCGKPEGNQAGGSLFTEARGEQRGDSEGRRPSSARVCWALEWEQRGLTERLRDPWQATSLSDGAGGGRFSRRVSKSRIRRLHPLSGGRSTEVNAPRDTQPEGQDRNLIRAASAPPAVHPAQQSWPPAGDAAQCTSEPGASQRSGSQMPELCL